MRCINKVQHSRLERFFAILFTIIIVLGAVKVPIQAAEPQVSVDESVYVTMDYYGKITDTSIVKGCDLNKNYQFVDYGNYSKVMNMSTNDEPKLGVFILNVCPKILNMHFHGLLMSVTA